MRTMQTLLRANIEVLRQGLNLIERLEPDLYAKPEPRLGLSGVGSHLRHVIDFYARFFDGAATGKLDYDQRQRDRRIETDAVFAAQTLRALMERLDGFEPEQSGTISTKQDACNAWADSSVERELGFVHSHTVHHYALIAIVLRAHGVEPGAEFGVAPSTLVHWSEDRACAQ